MDTCSKHYRLKPHCVIMSPLRRHIFVCFLAKWGFFSPSSVKRGRTHIVLGWNMSGASTSTYPENLGSGGQLPAELRGRVSFFCLSVCLPHYVARHRKPRRCVYVLNLGGTGIRPPDSFSFRSNFRSSFTFSFRSSFCFRSRSCSCSTTSGDIFYCSGSRQLNHSSLQWTYSVSQKKHATKLLFISSSNIDRFLKFFHWHTLW